MRKINVKDVPETELKSPKGKFHHFRKPVSVALGRDANSTDMLERHPFDFEVARIPPGGIRCPYHFHSAQWELYVVISGRGTVRHKDGNTEVTSGDAFLFGPGEAHQISNHSAEDLVYHVIADNPFGGACHYPDSKKWLIGEQRPAVVLKGEEADYFEGEE